MKNFFLILGISFFIFLWALPVGAGVILTVTSSESEASQEFQEFFGILQFNWNKLQREQTSLLLFCHEFMVVEHKRPKWVVILHPWVGAKYLDILTTKKELSEFVWKVDGEKLKSRNQRRKKAEEAARWLQNKVRVLDQRYQKDLRDKLEEEAEKINRKPVI